MSHLILGIDFGTKYVGVAIGDTITQIARPLTTIVATKQSVLITEIKKIIAKWDPYTIVIGDPGDIKGAKLIQQKIYNFVEFLKKIYKKPIVFTQESLTTWQAKKNLNVKNVDKNKLLTINAEAARILLQQWLDQTQTK